MLQKAFVDNMRDAFISKGIQNITAEDFEDFIQGLYDMDVSFEIRGANIASRYFISATDPELKAKLVAAYIVQHNAQMTCDAVHKRYAELVDTLRSTK